MNLLGAILNQTSEFLFATVWLLGQYLNTLTSFQDLKFAGHVAIRTVLLNESLLEHKVAFRTIQ